MTNFCTASNQIGSYAASSSSTTQNIITKNIDCVNLDADLVATGNLTVDGVDLSSYPDIVEKTQNIVSTPPGTSFTGPLTASGLNVTQIAANDPLLGIEIGSVLNHTMASTTGTFMYNMINPSLGTGFNDNMGLEIGTSKTTDNAWQMLYVNNATALSRRLDFRMRGYSTPTLCLTRGKVGVGNSAPTEALDVTGNAKIGGSLTTTLPITTIPQIILTGNFADQTTQTPGIPTTAKKIRVTFNAVGISSNGQIRMQVGDSSTILTTGYNVECWSRLDSEFDSNGIICTHKALGNSVKLYGYVQIYKIYTNTLQTAWNWGVEGNIFQTNGASIDGTAVSGLIDTTDTFQPTRFKFSTVFVAGSFNVVGSTINYSYEN